MPKYWGRAEFDHAEIPALGVLLTNLGTPDEPTAPALRRYLREFLLDPRVIELPRILWWTILHLFVLTRRPKASAKLYRSVWTDEGSPLLLILERQAAGVANILAREVPAPVRVAIGMRYGRPSIASGLRELAAAGCRKVVVLPLYPQYAAATTGSTWDAVADELKTWRTVPDLRFVATYHDEPGYLDALAASIRDSWGADGAADKLLFSFHGVPQRYYDAGDYYACLCRKTARLVAERLGLAADRYEVAFQSRFGREEWLKPYTDKTVEALARAGVRTLDVVCPGFSADCLETLEEIDGLNREIFTHAGGERFRYVPALNDRPDHLRLLADLAVRNLAGWYEPRGTVEQLRGEAEATAERARAIAACPFAADAGYGARSLHQP